MEKKMEPKGELKTETFEVEWEGSKERIVIRRLAFGERMRIRKDCRNARFIGGVQHVEIDEGKYALGMLKSCIVSAPFVSATDDDLNKVDGAVLQHILDRIESLNTIEEQKKPGSVTPSG